MSEEASVYMGQAADSAKGDASDAQERATSSWLSGEAKCVFCGGDGFVQERIAFGDVKEVECSRCAPPSRADANETEAIAADLINALRRILEQCDVHETHRRVADEAIDRAFRHKSTWWSVDLPPSPRQDEVARSASEASHPDVKQLDTNELRNAVLDEAARLLRGTAELEDIKRDPPGLVRCSPKTVEWRKAADFLIALKTEKQG